MTAPHPHARKRPNITISMLETLKHACRYPGGELGADRGVLKGLVKRGLARWQDADEKAAFITDSGRLLIRTQYDALKQVLPENRTAPEAHK